MPLAATFTRDGRPTGRRARSAAATLVTAALVAGWALFLRPPFLGGPTSYVLVAGKSMQPTMHTGDLALLHRQARYRVGDVIAYHVPQGELGAGALVIHRVIGGSATTGYRTQGDNRERPDLWRPTSADVAGRMWLHVPGAGRLLALARRPIVLATIAAMLTALILPTPSRRAARPGRGTQMPQSLTGGG